MINDAYHCFHKGNVISRVTSLLVTKLEHILPEKVMQALPSYLSMNDAERLQQGAQYHFKCLKSRKDILRIFPERSCL